MTLAGCPMCKSARAYATPLYAVQSNEIGDERYECTACGYMAVYRVQRRAFEPPKEQLSEAWQPPVLLPLPLTFDPEWPDPRKRPPASARSPLPGTDSRNKDGHKQSAAAKPPPHARAATSMKSAKGLEQRQASTGVGEPLVTQNRSGAVDRPADTRKPRRKPERAEPSSPGRKIRRHRHGLRPTQSGERAGSRTDRAKGRHADARDAIGDRSRTGQDQPATFGMHQVLTEQLAELRAHPDRDRVRTAQAIAQLAAGVRVLAEQTAKIEKQPIYPKRDMQNGGVIDQLIADVHRVLAEQIAILRAHADLDQIKKARVITRLASEEIRLRALDSCRATEALANFDLVAVLNEGLKEAERIIEEKKRLARSQEALAENSADERDGRSENPSPGGTTSTGS